MPNQEAPSNPNGSSTDRSLSPDLPRRGVGRFGGDVAVGLLPSPDEDRLGGIRLPEPEAERIAFLQLPHRGRNEPERVEQWPPMPPAVHLLPVALPAQAAESNLDELLRRVTERNDLQNVEAVRLRVISYTISLSHLAMFLPRLLHLDLTGSVLNSLRDLGLGLVRLTHLNVSNCGLNSFDGVSGTPALRELVADGNMIQRVGSLVELNMLQRFSAQNNRISELNLLTFLAMCTDLDEIDLRGNPVCGLPQYRATMQRSVSRLHVLDGCPLQETAATGAVDGRAAITPADLPSRGDNLAAVCPTNSSSTDGDVSSLSSEMYSAASEATDNSWTGGPVPFAQHHRPSTAPQHHALHSSSHSSPGNAALTHAGATAGLRRASLSAGLPVVGSVLGVARQRRPRRRNVQAWASSSSSSLSSASSARFPPDKVDWNTGQEHT